MSWNASREVIAWAARECEWQMSGEMSVLWMLDGWDYLCGYDTVRVGSSIKPHQREIPALMERLIERAPDAIEADEQTEWFRQYEEVHPFRDGNGRTGNILWNWLRGTLDRPEMPPNLWDDPRRDSKGEE